jgi:hypothetical protein
VTLSIKAEFTENKKIPKPNFKVKSKLYGNEDKIQEMIEKVELDPSYLKSVMCEKDQSIIRRNRRLSKEYNYMETERLFKISERFEMLQD